MTQPALIIGLGGTGRWVLTGIKKNLLEIHGGTMPSQVRLLSFDTVAEPSSNGLVAEPVQIGGVQLTASEYVFLSGQIYNVCQDIVGNRDTLPHLRTWFQAETYLQKLARDDFTLSRGAGQQRPFGRMALFLDLQAHSQSLVANRITQALREVRSGKEKVTIYIVASLSGGTGSGMFIDMAHLVRVIAGQHPVTIRGFLALQNAFGTVEHPMHIEPNTGAALRELDRFMHIFDQSYTITYSPQIPDRGKTTYGAGSGRLFDGCYLIDAERDRNPLARYKPLEGVYPSIADAITTLLDPSVGSKFDQDAQNVATRSSNAQMQADVPHYSSIGTYTLIFPSEDIITSLSYRFARELVGTWLLQIQEYTQKGTKTLRVTYAGNPRHEVDAFLQQPPSLNRRENSTFLDRTPTYIADINNQVNIEDVALYSAEALASWLQPVGEDTSVPARTGGITINEILARNLYESVIPKLKQDQDNPQIIASIIALVKAFREEIFGYKTDERWIGGIYRVALDRCIEVQKQDYRTLLLEQVTILLKTATDPALQHEQRGRLGFVRDFLRALGEGFGRLATFFEKVKVARKGQPPIPSLREDLQRAVDESRRAMNNTSGERQLGFLPPVIRGWFLKAEQAQDAYLSAEQELINYEMADLLIDALQKTAIALGEVTATFHEEVESWIKTLVEGISGEENDPSLYQRLVQAEEAHQRMRKAKAEIPIHEYVTDAAYEDALYESHLVRKLNEIMAHLQWAVTLTPQREAVRIQMTTLQVNRHGNTREERERVHRHNLDYLLSLARSYLAKPLHDQRIADLIEGKGEPPEALARRLHAKCSPLLSFDPNRGGRQEFHYYVCLKEDSKRDFFASLPDAFKQITDQAINYEVIPSADPHRCTILA
ncbi:MAG: tubulin-like doman-containing protein, partial [Chloroflexales bacterium]